MIEHMIKEHSAVAATQETRRRIVIDLDEIMPLIPGNVIEIGGGFGQTTL